MQSKATRRKHAHELKQAVIEQCQRPGASVSAVALAHGLNANLVRKWLHGRGFRPGAVDGSAEIKRERPGALPASGIAAGASALVKFLPVTMIADRAGATQPVSPTSAAAAADIGVELRRGNAALTVRWPSCDGQGCAAWLAELSAAMLR